MKDLTIKQIIIYILLFFFQIHSFAQPDDFKYYKQSYVVIPKVDSLYEIGEYRESIKFLLQKKDSIGIIPDPYSYILAQDYAVLRMPDSAFYYLNLYIDGKAKDYRAVYLDSDFELLRENHEEWNKILTRIEDIYLKELNPSMNKELSLKLFRLGIEEQRYGLFSNISCRRTVEPPLEEIIKHDIKVKKELKKIIRKHGFPTPSMVGQTAAANAFFILQHSNIETKYYHMVKKAYEKGDFWPEYYALLTDRWLRQNGKNQIYGTQLSSKLNSDGEWEKKVLAPVEDFKNVNQRRAELGLSSIEEYVKRMKGIIPEEYYNESDEKNIDIDR